MPHGTSAVDYTLGYRLLAREAAIRDGALVPVPTDLAAEAGFVWPIAVTDALWTQVVEWGPMDDERKGVPTGLTTEHRLWTLLWMARAAIASTTALTDGDPHRAVGIVTAVPREGTTLRAAPVPFIALAGPDDDGLPVMTLLSPGEDR